MRIWDPGSGMKNIWIWDLGSGIEKNLDPGSGMEKIRIRDKHLRSAKMEIS